MHWEGGRQEVDLSIPIGLARDRECAIQKQDMTTRGSGLMTPAIIQLIKPFIMLLLNIHTHVTNRNVTKWF
jgi:hypothetical protein